MNIGTVIGGGFALIRDRPRAVAVWGFIYFLIAIAMTLALGPVIEAQAAGGAAGGADTMLGRTLLVDLVYGLVTILVLTAVQRAVLHPQRSRFFYLRLGLDELRMFLLALVLGLGGYIVLVVGVITAVLFSAKVVGGIPLGILLAVILFAILLWLEVRMSLSFPLTMMRGKIVLGESWRLTRGRFWALLGTYFLVFLLLMALWSLVTALTLNSFLAQLAQTGFNRQGLSAATQSEMARQLQGLTPMAILALVVSSTVGVIGITLWGGTLAKAADELTVNLDKIAAAFA